VIELHINNPKMKNIFETQFQSNQEKFIEFIVSFIEDNKNAVENYFHKKNKPDIEYKKLNPMENYYTLEIDDNQTDMTNPFKDVKDSVTFAKSLREKSYR